MEQLRLSLFFRQVSSWPQHVSELGVLADRVRAALEVPFLALWVPELGMRVAGASAASDPNKDGLADFLAAKARDLQARGYGEMQRLTQIQLSQESAIWRDMGAVDHLAFLPLCGNNPFRTAAGGRDPRGVSCFGWLIAGTARPLTHRLEAAVSAIVQYLAELAVVKNGEEAITLRDQFLSIASHELKTPLTSIYGVLQLQERMLRPKPGQPVAADQEKQRSFFKVVIRQTERLNELIDGLLNVSRIQNGRFMVEPTDADAAAIVQDTVAHRLGVIAAEAGVRLEVEVQPGIERAHIDPVRFEEVVTNLGMNAIRFSPEGGTVRIGLREDRGDLVFAVRDQGPAVPEKDRERIFQPFERASRTSRLGGLGLGLFISKQIAQLHGGDVGLVESVPGRGNLIEARFPGRAPQRIPA